MTLAAVVRLALEPDGDEARGEHGFGDEARGEHGFGDATPDELALAAGRRAARAQEHAGATESAGVHEHAGVAEGAGAQERVPAAARDADWGDWTPHRERGRRPRPSVDELRTRIDALQGRTLGAPVLPVHPAIAGLLPDGGLRTGSAYSLGESMSLVLALLAEPSRGGAWCAVVGMPELGVEAAEAFGVDLERFVLVPRPAERWLAVASALADVMGIVVVRPPERARDADVARLAARLRERGTVLLVQGAWPQAEAQLTLEEPEWSGLGSGFGYLERREATVVATSRRIPVPRRGRVTLPGGDGALGGAAAPEGHAPERQVPELRASAGPDDVRAAI